MEEPWIETGDDSLGVDAGLDLANEDESIGMDPELGVALNEVLDADNAEQEQPLDRRSETAWENPWLVVAGGHALIR